MGERCFLAGKVGIDSGVKIGIACFLGGGAIVKKDLPDESVVPGPADAVAPYSSKRIKRLRFR